MEELATRGPTIVTSKPHVINNQYYGTNDDSSLYEEDDLNVKHDISNDAIMVSPSYADRISSSFYPTKSSLSSSSLHSTSQNYVTELPNYIQSSPSSYFTSSDEESSSSNYDNNNLIQFSQTTYDHSDITHTHVDSDVYSNEDDNTNNNIINPYPIPSNDLMTETRTTDSIQSTTQTSSSSSSSTNSPKFSKPIFKLKPTQSSISTEKYVLVHTITNDKQQQQSTMDGNYDGSTKKPSSTNDSIQSILLMLNGTNQQPQQNQYGPEYTVNSDEDNQNMQSTSHPSTSQIDYEKYGSSSYYITTKSPERITSQKVPSTSYVYSPNPTRRPTTSSKKPSDKTKTTTTRSVNKVKVSSTKSPSLIQKPTTLNVPSTSYIYSPNPITKRPMTSFTPSPETTATTQGSKTSSPSKVPAKKTSIKPVIVVTTTQQPQLNDEIDNNYVVISGGGITKHPSPTVHITPKPITNLLTSSTMHQLQTKKPSNDATTELPPAYYGSTTPVTFISSSIYVPSIHDFQNEGYFAVVTHRPGGSSTAIYSVSPGVLHHQSESDVKQPETDTPVMTNDDFSNFPPVRNPNLNMTATNNVHPVMDVNDISTPSFVEDAQLNSKIDLLVSKLVESMQGNLGDLVDILYERKNVTLENDNKNKKNGTITAKPKPPQKTTVSSKVTTKAPTKAPQRTTSISGRPGSQQTTKKTPTKTSTTAAVGSPTKKPTPTKKPASAKPATTTTKKPPNRITSSTTSKKPAKKTTSTTTTTTTKAPVVDDEQTYEEGEESPVEEEGDTVEETNEEGEETNVVDESESEKPPVVENGRVRKYNKNVSIVYFK